MDCKPCCGLWGMVPIGIQDENRMAGDLLANETQQAVIHAVQLAGGLVPTPDRIGLIAFLMAEPEAQQLAGPIDSRPKAATIWQHMFDGGCIGRHRGMTPKTAGILGLVQPGNPGRPNAGAEAIGMEKELGPGRHPGVQQRHEGRDNPGETSAPPGGSDVKAGVIHMGRADDQSRHDYQILSKKMTAHPEGRLIRRTRFRIGHNHPPASAGGTIRQPIVTHPVGFCS